MDNLHFVPMRRISVLSLSSFKKFEVNQEFNSDEQVLRLRREARAGLLNK